MLAIVYFIISAVFGICLVNLTVTDPRRLFVACAPSKKAIACIPNTLFTVPAGILVGLIVTGFFNYFVILGLSYFVSDGNLCKRIGVLITFAILIWLSLSIMIIINRRRLKKIEEDEQSEIPEYKYNIRDTLFFGIVAAVLTAVTTFLMMYTYRTSGDELLAGVSTFSDLAPHTAMVSSFSNGFNFPTQYMHFSGDGIQYHFLFYFFCGMLNYGGLSIDMSINLTSIVTMVCTLMLLGLLTMLLSGKKIAFALAPLLVFFRSSWNAFDHLLLLMKNESFPKALADIMKFDSWYEVTPYDSWGVWAINVYPNQRHLMLGVGLAIMVIILFMPYVRRMCISMIRAGGFGGAIKAFLFSRSSWIPRSEDSLNPFMLTILASITVIVMPYYHGSALIAMLLVLLGMAIFSECRLLYAITAACAVISSYIQTRIFSGSATNIVKFQWAPGFIVEDITAWNITKYILIVTGLTLILGIVVSLIMLIKDIATKRPIYRFLMFLSFLFPMTFAFLVQVSLEMLANHKFVQITLILVDAFVAILLANLFAIPYKIRKSASEAEAEAAVASASDSPLSFLESDPSVATTPSSTEPVVFNGELISGDVTNLADTSSGEEILDLPEEIDLPDEIEDPDDTTIEAVAGEDEVIKEVTEIGETEAGSEGSDEEDGDLDELIDGLLKEGNEDDSDDESDDVYKEDEEVAEDVEEEFKEPVTEVNETETSDTLPALREKTLSLSEPVEETLGDLPVEEVPVEEAADEEAADEDEEDTEVSPEAEGASEDDTGAGEESTEESTEEAEQEAEPEPAPEAEKTAAASHKGPKEISLGKFIALQTACAILALILLVPLTFTGVSEWATYINLNSDPIRLKVNSSMTQWIRENTDTSDVFLTPMWSLDEFYLAGRPSYYGWPYYAWSAGHDTDTRDQIYAWLITGCNGDIEEFTRYCKERGIKYVIADPDFNTGTYYNGALFNWDFFADNLTQVAAFNENGAKIYKVY